MKKLLVAVAASFTLLAGVYSTTANASTAYVVTFSEWTLVSKIVFPNKQPNCLWSRKTYLNGKFLGNQKIRTKGVVNSNSCPKPADTPLL